MASDMPGVIISSRPIRQHPETVDQQMIPKLLAELARVVGEYELNVTSLSERAENVMSPSSPTLDGEAADDMPPMSPTAREIATQIDRIRGANMRLAGITARIEA